MQLHTATENMFLSEKSFKINDVKCFSETKFRLVSRQIVGNEPAPNKAFTYTETAYNSLECHNIKFRDSYTFRIESIDIHSIINFLQRCCCSAPEITHDSWIKWFSLYCFPWKYYKIWPNHIEYLSFGVFDWQFPLCCDVFLHSFFPSNEYKIAFRWKYLRFRSTLVNSKKWCE